MMDRGETREQELTADDATLAFNALRQTVEKLAGDLNAEITIIRKGMEAAFDRFDEISRQADFRGQHDQLSEDIVLIAEHLKTLKASTALRFGPEDYGRMFELIANRVIVNLSRSSSNQVNAVTSQLTELVQAARDRDQQDRWLFMAVLLGLMFGGLLMLAMVRAFPRVFLNW